VNQGGALRALEVIEKKEKTKPENPNTYNSKHAVPGPFKPPVTITGMTGHVAGIIGHDHRNTQLCPQRANARGSGAQ